MIDTSRGRSKAEKKRDKLSFYGELAEEMPSKKASEAYKHKPYSVEGYLKKVGIDVTKGVDAGGAYDQRTASSISEQ